MLNDKRKNTQNLLDINLQYYNTNEHPVIIINGYNNNAKFIGPAESVG